jgi:hypothetical protein
LYRLHKQSGQGIVTLTDPIGMRKDYLLGNYDSPESRAEYVRIVSEWGRFQSALALRLGCCTITDGHLGLRGQNRIAGKPAAAYID